ncbi:helix-turn-helix domain-containing protein [Pseudotabrizicola algicola]|uniref:ImmA/IrrE family metallo-endopeptidase n=1 Tax=Pseudotabrizicola algicola TaxID=2709381 RepID=A0A6B3RZ30_9RHOB|nr:XRE family transcriptional regulator [Pseudotabrizicola algicola]NEX48409.1 ImmA/IrrE family metallo-endopeptidase [Pseudotabrizicola algicola]
MRVGTPGFVPERLAEVRAARRILSMKELAQMIGVSPSAVSRWESGTHAPDAEALTALARELRVRREYFLRPVHTSEHPMFSRSLSSALKRDTSYQDAQMQWLQEISAVLQHYVDFPAVDIPDVMKGLAYRQLRDEDIEGIAQELRSHWRLGQGPIIDMVALLERVGCVVGSIEMGTSKLDGLCSWSLGDERPHIMLATDKMSLPRRQMDAAHELGHAILHKGVRHEELKSDLKEIERQAFRFASAFLMPETTFVHEVQHYSLAGLLSVKERWRVSVKAQIRRLLDLEVIPEHYGTQLYKSYSANGWNKVEPLDREWPVPEPAVLRNALSLIVESGTRTKEDLLAVEFTMHPGDIENLTGLPPGWFNRQEASVVQLSLKQDAAKPHSDAPAGEVVPFARR